MRAYKIVASLTRNGEFEYDYDGGTLYPYFDLTLADRAAASSNAYEPSTRMKEGGLQNVYRVESVEIDPAAGCWGWVNYHSFTPGGKRKVTVKDGKIRNIRDMGNGIFAGIARRSNKNYAVTIRPGFRNWAASGEMV